MYTRLATQAHYKMKFLAIVIFWTLYQPGGGFFAKLFDYGPRSSNCDKWSIFWSPCYTTSQKTMFMHVPAKCMNYNPVVANFVQNGGIYTLNLAYKWLKKVNKSRGPCGMCSFQISCSSNCDNPDLPQQQLAFGQGFSPFQPGANQYGISQRPCPNVDQTNACQADPNQAWDPNTGLCQMWPPIRDQAMPDSVGPTKQVIQYNVPPTPCIFIGGKCYCCCYPYIPDATTLKCVKVAGAS